MNFTGRTLSPIYSVHKSTLLLALTLDWLVGKKYEQLWRLPSITREMEKKNPENFPRHTPISSATGSTCTSTWFFDDILEIFVCLSL